MNSKIWHIRRRDDLPKTDDPWQHKYDTVVGMIIHAETEEDARRYAYNASQAELMHEEALHNAWLDAHLTVCVEVPERETDRVLLIDFRHFPV